MIKRAIKAAPLQAIGPYNLAIEVNGALYVSGQIHLDPESEKLVGDNVSDQTKQCFDNLESVLISAGYTIYDVVKTTVYLIDMDDFSEMNDIYGAYVKAPFPARSTIQVAGLPLGARVEIEAIAIKNSHQQY